MERRRITKDTVLEKIDNTLKLVDDEIGKTMKSTEKNKSTRCLKKVKKQLTELQKDIPKIKRPPITHKNSFFSAQAKISEELKQFLGIDNDQISRQEVLRALSTYIHIDDEDNIDDNVWAYLNPTNRDLRDPKDKRCIIPDEKLSELLGYKEFVESVKKGEYVTKKDKKVITDPRLTYCRITALLQKHYLKSKKKDIRDDKVNEENDVEDEKPTSKKVTKSKKN